MRDNLKITNETSGSLPISKLPLVLIKNKILGKKYELGLTFITPEKSKILNKQYRKKNKPTDILSFPISENEGDIFIDILTSKKEMVKFNRNFSNFICFLFIHGLLHLKGMVHGDKMEAEEKSFRKIFNI